MNSVCRIKDSVCMDVILVVFVYEGLRSYSLDLGTIVIAICEDLVFRKE